MRRQRKQFDDETEVDMTPMLDIVFIMLIFFIVTTSFVKESGIDVNRPTAQTAERKERGHIIVSINPNGEIWIDKRVVDIRAVRANIERMRNGTEHRNTALMIFKRKGGGSGHDQS